MCLASNDWMLSSLNRPPCTLGLDAVAPFRAVPEPCLESTPNMCKQRRASIFPPLADTSDVKPRAEMDGIPVEADQFGEAQAGLNLEQQQGIVTAAAPGSAIGRAKLNVHSVED